MRPNIQSTAPLEPDHQASRSVAPTPTLSAPAGPSVRDLLAVSAVSTVPVPPMGAESASEEGERRWQERANCLGVDPDLFFPERGASTREAKAVCGSCEVRAECLEYALDHAEKFGIWGGLSERERRRLRRQRALARRNAASA